MQEKLIFYFSAMKGGKTTRIFQKLHDLEENGQNVLVIKPQVDTKGSDMIINRQKESRKVDILLKPDDTLLSEQYIKKIWYAHHILVDEAQFLEEKQIEELWEINKNINIPITCFGLKSNFQGELFAGSAKLIALADEIVELDSNSLCPCGAPAKFNARMVNGGFTMEGSEIEIDGANQDISYVPLCGKCYFDKIYSKKKMKKHAKKEE